MLNTYLTLITVVSPGPAGMRTSRKAMKVKKTLSVNSEVKEVMSSSYLWDKVEETRNRIIFDAVWMGLLVH